LKNSPWKQLAESGELFYQPSIPEYLEHNDFKVSDDRCIGFSIDKITLREEIRLQLLVASQFEFHVTGALEKKHIIAPNDHG